MRQADKDKYFNNIEIKPVDIECQREIESNLILEEKKGVEKCR